jgi:hypothetical protein
MLTDARVIEKRTGVRMQMDYKKRGDSTIMKNCNLFYAIKFTQTCRAVIECLGISCC